MSVIVLDILIQATYEDGALGNAVEHDFRIHEPPTTQPGEELDAWADAVLKPLTGIGLVRQHASYVVTLTRSSDLRLLLASWAWSG